MHTLMATHHKWTSGMLLLGALVLSLSFAGLAEGTPCGLTWMANAEPDLAGYKVYERTGAGYGAPLATLGKVTTFDCSKTGDGATHFFSITAYDSAGQESPLSNEVSKLFPKPTPVAPKGLVITSATPDEVIIVASIIDCPRVLTSITGTTSTTLKRTVRCVQE